MSPLLENAIVSIRLGLEDFRSKGEGRTISSVRNLYSGTLLLCKEVLRRKSPPNSNDLYIRNKKKEIMEADGTTRWVGVGEHTIGRGEIEKTFKQLDLPVDLSGLGRLAKIRNDIEHMHSSHAPALIREAIADAMPIIRDVIVTVLKDKPSTLLGQDAWDVLLNEARVFRTERAACKESFNNIIWGTETLWEAVRHFRCSHCSSILLRNNNPDTKIPQDLLLVCSRCGQSVDCSEVIEAALAEHLGWDNYQAAKESEEPALDRCPECSKETYVLAEDKCLNPDCDFSLNNGKCLVCGAQLTLDDYQYSDGNLCSYDFYILSKDD